MSSNQPSRLSPSLKAVTPAHLIVSVLITALIAAGDAGLQYFQSNGGAFSLVQLIGAVLVALFATLGTGVITLESNPTVEAAIDGKLATYQSQFNSVLSQHKDVVNQGAQVVNYLMQLAQQQANTVQPSVVAPVARPQPVQQPVAPQPMVMPPAPPLPTLPTYSGPQVPFPQSSSAASGYGNLSFGDTGIVPTLPK